MVDQSDWGTESGLLENFIITVEESYFTTDARYNSGETLLLRWKGHAVDADTGEQVLFGKDEDEEVGEVSFPCGGGWLTNDGGETAEHDSGRAKKGFNKNSAYGKVIDRALGDFNLGQVLMDRGRPQEAKVWVGLKFLMKYEETDYGGEIGKRSRLMPVSFEGEADGGAAVPSTAAAPTTETANVPSNQVLEDQVKAIAAASSTHSEFLDKALEVEGVSDDPVLLERVVDEAGLYAEVKATS